MTRSPRVLGLMSGTSADGIDAALLELPGWPEIGSGGALQMLTGPAPRTRVVEHAFTPYPPEVRAQVLAAARDDLSVGQVAQLHTALGELLAEAALPFTSADLISAHGQTVQHQPHVCAKRGWTRPSTLQLGEAAFIVERTGKPVVADFRPSDLAAGGQAAPLVPYADRLQYAEDGIRRAVHNLGGISNLTYLPGLDEAGVLAFDTGPANCLIDEAANKVGQDFDEGGRLAASGQVNEALIEAWLQHPELRRPPPKSTGREVWHLGALPAAEALNVPDLAATVTAFTARSIAGAYQKFILPLGLDEIVVAGGGARNPVLMGQLRDLLSPIPVLTFAERGWDALGHTDVTREAAAFALLGYARAQGWTNTLPQATGARHAVIAGKLLVPAPRPSGGQT